MRRACFAFCNLSGTKQSPGEKEKGGNRNRGGIFSKDLPAFFQLFVISSNVFLIVKDVLCVI